MDEIIQLDALWNFSDPAESETKFREVLPGVQAEGDPDRYLQLLTQLARTFSLRRMFAEAHAQLDEVEALLTPDTPAAHIRYCLERGRTYNSNNQHEQALPFFLEAFERGQMAGEDNLAIDAAHMIAIAIQPAEKQVAWSEIAMEMAEASQDEKARKWLGPLYNNLGWTYHDAGDYQKALELFEKSVVFREAQDEPVPIRIAHWSVARTYRSVGRVEEALAIQEALAEQLADAGESDGYVFEELAECYLLMGREEEAKPYFMHAYELLSQDGWLKANETARLSRLKTFGK